MRSAAYPAELAKEMVATAAAVVSTTSWSASFVHQTGEVSMLVKRHATCTPEEQNTKTCRGCQVVHAQAPGQAAQ